MLCGFLRIKISRNVLDSLNPLNSLNSLNSLNLINHFISSKVNLCAEVVIKPAKDHMLFPDHCLAKHYLCQLISNST